MSLGYAIHSRSSERDHPAIGRPIENLIAYLRNVFAPRASGDTIMKNCSGNESGRSSGTYFSRTIFFVAAKFEVWIV